MNLKRIFFEFSVEISGQNSQFCLRHVSTTLTFNFKIVKFRTGATKNQGATENLGSNEKSFLNFSFLKFDSQKYSIIEKSKIIGEISVATFYIAIT